MKIGKTICMYIYLGRFGHIYGVSPPLADIFHRRNFAFYCAFHITDNGTRNAYDNFPVVIKAQMEHFMRATCLCVNSFSAYMR